MARPRRFAAAVPGDGTPDMPGSKKVTDAGKVKSAGREARLALKLRENLARRKDKARAIGLAGECPSASSGGGRAKQGESG